MHAPSTAGALALADDGFLERDLLFRGVFVVVFEAEGVDNRSSECKWTFAVLDDDDSFLEDRAELRLFRLFRNDEHMMSILQKRRVRTVATTAIPPS